jgi:isocitrate dehydrogenase kinase/phosphatase
MGHNLVVPNARSNRAAAAIADAYERWQSHFHEVTRRAPARFECRDWLGAQADAAERLHLYKLCQDAAVAAIPALLDAATGDLALWTAARDAYAELFRDRPDDELAETFFNSVTRRVLATVGVNAAVEFTRSVTPPDALDDPPIARRYTAATVDAVLARRVLEAIPWTVPYAQLERDAALVAQSIDARIRSIGAAGAAKSEPAPVAIEMLSSVFFRNKGAYVVGRIHARGQTLPLVLPLLHAERGIVVDAVLMTEHEASVVFGFSWSYFQVEAPRPRALVAFLQSIMPRKRIDELYNAIGYNKHGKTELYRTLMRHLQQPEARFAPAEGEEGLVMAVFTLPALSVVFKVIKDRYVPPKQTTRQAVMDKYHFVFIRDRVGRLADAQEFAQLEFPKRCFPPELLAYLRKVAGQTVLVAGDRVVIRHLYTERQVIPLNLFLRDAPPDVAREAVIDFGHAFMELAAADIFAGDMLLKNFGITRHGRVICYDYDELCLLSDCRFRHIPPPRSPEEEIAAEPWFPVGEPDVFPEEFATFLAPSGPLRGVFLEAHGDLLRVETWQAVQHRLAAGEIFDVFPYQRSARLQRGERSAP